MNPHQVRLYINTKSKCNAKCKIINYVRGESDYIEIKQNYYKIIQKLDAEVMQAMNIHDLADQKDLHQ